MRKPKEIRRQGTEGISIVWDDDSSYLLPSRLLREHCPSAVTKAKQGDQSHDKPLTPKKSSLAIVESSTDEELALIKIWPVGNYALGMEWADGHNTGIYPFGLLDTLCTLVKDS